MIVPGKTEVVSRYVYVDGSPGVPDSITAVLWRVVAGVREASGVSVTVATTANTGEYTFTWTNSAEWNRTDDLILVAIPVIDGEAKPDTIWESHGHVDAVMRGTDSAETETAAAARATALTSAINGIEVSPEVTVNPTELSNASVEAIQDGLATSSDVTAAKEEVLSAIGEIEGGGATAEEIATELERTDGPLWKLFKKFDGIDKLIKWIRQ